MTLCNTALVTLCGTACDSVLYHTVVANVYTTSGYSNKFAFHCSHHLNKKFKELKFDTQSLLPPVSAKEKICKASANHCFAHL